MVCLVGLFLQKISDFGQEDFFIARSGRCWSRLFHELVDCLDDEEEDKGQDQEADDFIDEQADLDRSQHKGGEIRLSAEGQTDDGG